MPKIPVGPHVFLYPMPVVLVGATVGGRPNFMTCAWVTRVNAQPPMIAVALNRVHHTPVGIRENRSFSVNVPSADLLEKTDCYGLVSGRDADKGRLFSVFYGETGTAPLIGECPLSLECRLVEVHEYPTNALFTGEILAAFSEERFLSDGKPDIRLINPITLTMPDNRYWAVGQNLGRAWSDGQELARTLRQG